MKSILLFIYGSMFLFSNLNAQNTETTIEDLIKNQFALYPKMEARDLYKFLHQAAMGSEHAVQDTNAVKVWMTKEVAGLDTTITNELIEQLSPDGNLVRVNLRPYLKAGDNPDELLKAFVSTANKFSGSINTLAEYIVSVKKMIARKEIPVDENIFTSLTDELAKNGFPSIHHSLTYEKLYKPAYRVVDRRYLRPKK
jgi:hypothetical protein